MADFLIFPTHKSYGSSFKNYVEHTLHITYLYHVTVNQELKNATIKDQILKDSFACCWAPIITFLSSVIFGYLKSPKAFQRTIQNFWSHDGKLNDINSIKKNFVTSL